MVLIETSMLVLEGRRLTCLQTAIISVYNKTGLLDLAKGLIKNNVRLLASGGTAKMIREAGFEAEYGLPSPFSYAFG